MIAPPSRRENYTRPPKACHPEESRALIAALEGASQTGCWTFSRSSRQPGATTSRLWRLSARIRGTERLGSEPALPKDRAIWFGPFCLRPAAHLLLEAETPVHIGARALDLLIVLVEHAGQVVTKDELFARVWPGLVVDEGNLRTQVALLRKVLRDGQSGARYLVTVPGRGYRFVAPVSATAASQSHEPPASSIDSSSGLPTRLTRLIGRADAVSDILGRLNRHRFVTIVGPGGICKTSVAISVAEQAAASYPDGVFWVDCAPLLGTSLVSQKLAAALGLDVAVEDPTRGSRIPKGQTGTHRSGCTGNICRSPMAEGLFPSRHARRTVLQSCPPGWARWKASRPAPMRCGRSRNWALTFPVSAAACYAGDGGTGRLYLRHDPQPRGRGDLLFPQAAEKTFLLREFDETLDEFEKDISDPIGGSYEIYFYCRDQIEQGIFSMLSFMDQSGGDAGAPARRRVAR